MKLAFTMIFMVVLLVACGQQEPGPPESAAESEYLQLAAQVEAWINSVAISEGNALFWPALPETTQAGDITLYSGSPGVVLFYLEHYKATRDQASRQKAEQGAVWLMSQAHADRGGYFWAAGEKEGNPLPDAGLYTGTAGVGSVFLALYQELGDSRYLKYARGAADWLVAAAESREQGVAWNRSNDVISGVAGSGLFLIQAAQQLNQPRYLDTAKKAGTYLISQAITDKPGVKWRAFGDWPRLYPNFSHGTSGIAYYLAVLYRQTREKRFLEAALQGAEWLKGHQENQGEGAAWYHHEPDGKDLYYVSWCHGPAGTARLFYQLYLVTADEQWMDWVKQAATWTMSCGLFEKPLAGFWNVSLCCGTAGVGDFFADLYRITSDQNYWLWAQKAVQELKQKASPGNPGLKWVQAENRVEPDVVYAQTGYDQGAAGIGLFFLKMYALKQEKTSFRPLSLPDTPFGWN